MHGPAVVRALAALALSATLLGAAPVRAADAPHAGATGAAAAPASDKPYGDWKKLFTGLGDIDKVTAADVLRVARQYFVESGRTVAFTVAPKGGAQ